MELTVATRWKEQVAQTTAAANHCSTILLFHTDRYSTATHLQMHTDVTALFARRSCLTIVGLSEVSEVSEQVPVKTQTRVVASVKC